MKRQVIIPYDKKRDEKALMKMIENEEGWDYANEDRSETYKNALEKCISYVAYEGDILCGYSRSVYDNSFYIYVCDLLVKSPYRGQETGKKLMECIVRDYPELTVYVMSDVDIYYEKLGYKKEGSIFEIT